MGNGRWGMVSRLAVLTAAEIVLSRFLSIPTPQTKLGFAFLPLALAGTLYGLRAGFVVGALSDLLGALLFPIGPYFPGFTLTAGLKGLVFGLLLHRKRGAFRVAAAVILNGVVLSLGVNTLWLHLLYGTPVEVLLLNRGTQELLAIPLQIVTLLLVASPKVLSVLEGQKRSGSDR